MRATRFLVLLLVLSCQRPDAVQREPSIEEQSQQARAELDAIMATWERWLVEGKVDSMATIVAVDGHTLVPNQPPLVGRAAWLAMFRPQLTQGKWRIDNVAESVVAYGPLAVEQGSFVLSFTPPPGAPSSMRAISDTGKYLWHWRKFNGQWQVAQAAWNSNRPAQP